MSDLNTISEARSAILSCLECLVSSFFLIARVLLCYISFYLASLLFVLQMHCSALRTKEGEGRGR